MESRVINVYFDGKCSLCKKEIAYYKTVAPKNTFLWKDIASEYDGNGNPIEEDIEEDLDYGWSEVDQNNFLDDCNSESEMDMTAYCDCALEIVIASI